MRKFSTSEYLRAATAALIQAPGYLIRPRLSEGSIVRFQEGRIKKLLRHAFHHCEFYRQKYRDHGVQPEDFRSLADLELFPTVSKEELISAMECGALGLPDQATIESVSSGSSGRVIRVHHGVRNTSAYAVGRYRILNMTGELMPWSKTLYVYTSEFPARSLFGLFPSRFVSTLNDLHDTLKTIRSYRPHILCIYPSRLIELMSIISAQEGPRLGIRFISLNSETSYIEQRRTMAEFFQCSVLDEYSTEELGWVASECEHGSYHLWEDMCYVEVVEPDADRSAGTGQLGEIVGTNLHNFTTPFIRYRQADLGAIDSQPCHCKRRFRKLQSLVGRKNDAFKFADQILSPSFLLDSVYELLLDGKFPIVDFCMIQEDLSTVRFQYVAHGDVRNNLESRLEESLRRRFPREISILIERPNTLEKTATGKRNPIISKIK
ncbi:MAG: phenylacetate--CoA ligase family protein [Leptospiraceae bacterium]|nr:phenylacetate--CoA ligase family protein [Leptospiraceae bacterium]